MIAETMTRPVAPAATANGAQMKVVLEQSTAANGIGARLASLPKRAARALMAALKVFKLDAVANGIAAAWARLKKVAGGLLGKLSMIGYGTLAGVVLTAGGIRRPAVQFTAKTYRFATTPLRWLGTGVRLLGLGQVVDFFSRQTVKVEQFVARNVNKSLAWLDTHEHSGAMRWGRTVFQATFIQRALRLVFPWAGGTWVFVASLFVPTFGLERQAIKSEEAAIKRAADHLRVAGEAVAGIPTAKIEVPVEEFARDTETDTLYKVTRFADPDGDRWVKIGEFLYAEDEVPASYEFGTVIGQATEAEVIAAQKTESDSVLAQLSSTTVGAASPAGNRDNRRAAAAKGKRK